MVRGKVQYIISGQGKVQYQKISKSEINFLINPKKRTNNIIK